ncbi:MAG: YfhO family protein [Candidatus Gottesmanbacteria bacterium]|nr:YfhO family protein [Candidatus Gottesmanbacteria bacterium]
MKQLLRNLLFPLIIIVVCAIFFYPTFLWGKLPVPTDTLIGLYHPWRDLYGATNPRGVPYKNFLITDPIRQQIPWRKLVVDSLKQGKLPSWNPYSFAGTPLLGNIQAGALYPMNILFLFMPFYIAWTILIIIQPILAALFLYLYLRNKKILPFVAVFAGVVWAFCGFAIAWLTWGTIVQTVLWLPLMLLAIDKILDSNGKKTKICWAVLLSASSVFALFAGHAQVALYIFVFAGAYGIFGTWNTMPRKSVWWIVIAATVAAVISSIQWIPVIRLISHSSRITDAAAWLKEGWFLPWQHLAQFVAPDFFGNPATLNYWGVWNYGEFIGYIGILPLLLSIFAIVTRRDRLTKFFTVSIGIVFLLLLPTPIAKLPYQFHLPIISSLQPTRFMVLIDICLVILAGLGLDAYLKKPNKKILFGIAFIGIVIVGLWIYATRVPGMDVSKRNLMLPSVLWAASSSLLLLGFVFKKRWNTLFVLLIISVTMFDLFRFGWKFTPFTPMEYFFPSTQAIVFLQSQPKPFRVMSLDNRILPPNTAAYYGIESVEGYDPLYNARYEEFIAALNRQKPDIAPPFGFNRIITLSTVNSRLLPLLNVKYILSLDDLKGTGLEFVYQEGQTKIYQYRQALPRIYPVESVVHADSKQQSMDILYSSTFNPVREAVVEDQVTIAQSPVSSGDLIDVMEEYPSEIRARSSLANDHFVVITNMYDPGWKAYIDSKLTPIYRTNYLFQGIRVPKGDHTIVVRYQ